jgi:signal transduction histidine kinase
MERNKYAFQFKRLPAHQIVESVARTVRPRFAVPGCAFEVQIPPQLPEIHADADTLATALINLLDNAYKYSEASKHIVLRATAKEGCVAFEVEDNGIGIPARETTRIFDDFYQVDQQLSRKAGGCGLGLSIVQLIMKAHMGAIRVSSQPGQGSKFTLLLPALAASPSTPQEVIA